MMPSSDEGQELSESELAMLLRSELELLRDSRPRGMKGGIQSKPSVCTGMGQLDTQACVVSLGVLDARMDNLSFTLT